jgi:hypothetical protein
MLQMRGFGERPSENASEGSLRREQGGISRCRAGGLRHLALGIYYYSILECHADILLPCPLQPTSSPSAHMDLARLSPSPVKAFALSLVSASSLLRQPHSSTDLDILVGSDKEQIGSRGEDGILRKYTSDCQNTSEGCQRHQRDQFRAQPLTLYPIAAHEPPKTLTTEYQEQMTEKAREQNLNPITGESR